MTPIPHSSQLERHTQLQQQEKTAENTIKYNKSYEIVALAKLKRELKRKNMK